MTPAIDPQKLLFELLRRFRILTMAIITAVVCGGSENAAKKLILRSRDYIASDPLGPRTVYCRFTPAGAKLIGAPEEIARPLGPQALPKMLGILGFCSSSPSRDRYIRSEFVDDFPELAKELLGKDYHTDFFLDFDGEHARLAQMVVDLNGDYKKLISKCRVRLREYLEYAGMRDIVADGLFTIAIIVAEEEKAQAIRLSLKEKPLRARVIVEVSAELQKCPIQGLGGE